MIEKAHKHSTVNAENVEIVTVAGNLNMSSARCTGVTYTNPQVREDPGFSLQLLGYKPIGLFRRCWLIGQKTCFKTAITIEVSMVIAVLSFLKEDKGWTKNVFRMHGND